MSTLAESTPTAAESAALSLLKEGQRFVLSGHIRPDGDCIGAQAALASVLRSMGKEVWILNPDPIEPQFDYLKGENRYRVYKGGDLPVHDVSVLLDISELSRCGDLGDALDAYGSSKKLVIDHHIHVGEEWWDEAYVDVTASATGLLVYRIAKHLGVSLSDTGACGVFTSIVTDTGWFKYSNTDAETLRVASDMLELGVDSSLMFGSIYQRRRSSHPSETGDLLSSTVYYQDRRLAVICSSREENGADGVDPEDALDILRSVGTVEVVLFLRELASGMVKLSARSKNDYDVNALARRFGGGGHRKASGALIQGTLQDVRSRLVSAAASGFDAIDGGLR
ncbi:MAG: phosphoesterase RecJ-like protein [Planctomycetota bacterium]|jgi:phosphoesterase RecJ-like protein